MLAGLSSCGISSRQVSVGDDIQLCGSPFGCLAPAVFLDHTVRGTISAVSSQVGRPPDPPLMEMIAHLNLSIVSQERDCVAVARPMLHHFTFPNM